MELFNKETETPPCRTCQNQDGIFPRQPSLEDEVISMLSKSRETIESWRHFLMALDNNDRISILFSHDHKTNEGDYL